MDDCLDLRLVFSEVLSDALSVDDLVEPPISTLSLEVDLE